MTRTIARALLAPLALVLLAGLMPTSAQAATTKLGASCKKAGQIVKVGSTRLVCKKNAKAKLVWQKYQSKDCLDSKADYAAFNKEYTTQTDNLAKIQALINDPKSGLSAAEIASYNSLVSQSEAQLKLLKTMLDQISANTALLCK